MAFLPDEDKIHWVKGMYNLCLTISPVPEKSTTLKLITQIFGYGETSLPLLRATPGWPLESKGITSVLVMTLPGQMPPSLPLGG